MELEGLRGLAAIVVVIHHFLYGFFPYLLTGPSAVQHMRFEDNLYGTPLAIVYAGTFAVAVFFVLSGFVLSIAYFQTKRVDIVKKLASKRYLRLMLPALASTLLAFLLLSIGVSHFIDSAASISKSGWLDGSWSFDTNILQALYSGAVGIFLNTGSPFNNVLWTMKTEFLGSFLVFAFLLLFARSQHRWIGYIALGILTFNTWYLAFVIGMAIADAYALGWMSKIRYRLVLVPTLITSALFLGAYPKRPDGTMYEIFNLHIEGVKIDNKILFLTLGATLLILGVMLSKRVAEWMRSPKVSVLGKYTFSLYLTHLLVLYSFTTIVFLYLNPILGYTKSVFAAFVCSVPVLWLATIIFEKYIDAPSIRFAKYIATMHKSDKRADLRERVRVLGYKLDSISQWPGERRLETDNEER